MSKFDRAERLAVCTYESFESFNAFFRVLKSQEGSKITSSEIHHGAHLCGSVEFVNHHLKFEEAIGREKFSV